MGSISLKIKILHKLLLSIQFIADFPKPKRKKMNDSNENCSMFESIFDCNRLLCTENVLLDFVRVEWTKIYRSS